MGRSTVKRRSSVSTNYSKKYVVENINEYYNGIKINLHDKCDKLTKLLFYDFEVFKEDWLVVIIDYYTKQKIVIINDSDKLKSIYEEFKNDIWIGYNSRNYDSTIFKAILMDMNPKYINDKLIVEGLKAYQINRDFYNIPFISYDTMVTRGESLKQLEGMMGHMIKESDVNFNIDRKLTKDEIEETIYYCTHDVEETIKVFENTKSDFDAHIGLIEEFNLPITYINKTKAQLSSIILGAERLHGLNDEMEYEFLSCIKLDKYNYIKEWFDNNRVLTYVNEKGTKKPNKLDTEVYGLKTTYAFGGLHGAIPKYYTDDSDGSLIVHSDVSSLYPSIMINHNLLSRAVKEPEKYSNILKKRLKLKREGKKKEQAPLKIVLNGSYGITLDEHSNMKDPKRGREICINGQLLLTDLMEKIENEFGDKCELLNSNTDGLIFKIKNKDDFDKYKEICNEWENRVDLKLEHDLIKKIYQKDVNNYVFLFDNGKLECKGSYLQMNNNLKNDMSILNDSVRNYLMNGIRVEDTINNCDELIKFQHINKIGNTYHEVRYGNKVLNERVIRTFACTEDLPGLFKVKWNVDKNTGEKTESVQKVANNSEKVFIDNDNIEGKKCPEYLDKQWYINEAIKRLKSFGIKYE